MFKRLIIYFLLLGTIVTSCRKDKTVVLSDNAATIVQARYACGTGCDAVAFIIKTSGNEMYTPQNLPDEFRINGLTVKIKYKRTGNYPGMFTAPNYELIILDEVSR